jgi:hypothetical protein
MEGPMSKKTKEPPKRPNHKPQGGYLKFPNPLLSQEAYQIRKGEDLLKGLLKWKFVGFFIVSLGLVVIYILL